MALHQRRKFEDEKNPRLLCELTRVSYEAFLYSETCKYLDVIYFTFRIIFVSFEMLTTKNLCEI